MKAQPKPQRVRDEDYLRWIRTRPCIVTWYDNTHCNLGPIDANHILSKGGGKTGSKADDRRALPFCRRHHQIYHRRGRDVFVSFYGIDLEKQITLLNLEYGFSKQKRVRQKSTTVKRVTVACECGQSHDLAASKFGFSDKSFVCPRLNRLVCATVRTA